MPKYTLEDWEHWVDIIQCKGRGLTKWEEDFIESLAEQIQVRASISEKQEEILERIYAEKT